MDKKPKLMVLINSSNLLTKEEKADLLKRLKEMSEATVNLLGVLLATEKKKSLESTKPLETSIDNLMSSLNIPSKS